MQSIWFERLMPTDLNGLKVQLVKLLELFGGSLPLGRIHIEYQKCFGRPIWVSDYGTSRVIHLLNKMSDVISVEGKGENKLSCLKNSLTEATKSHDWKGKEIRADNTGVVSSDELSRDQRMVVEEQDNKSDKTEAKIEEKSIVYREISIVPPPSSDIKGSKVLISKSNSPSSGLNDLNGLKFRLVKLLEMYNGCLPIARLNSEYKKVFGKPFHLSDYGASRAVQLLKKMTDVISVEGKGDNKLVYLKNSLMEAAKSHDMKGKGVQHENTGVVSSNEKVVIEENDKRSDHEILNDFKYELQEILKSHSCWIYLGCFEEIYQQRYKIPLDYKKFGVNKLEELFEKVKDVVALPEEPSSKKKFLVAVGL